MANAAASVETGSAATTGAGRFAAACGALGEYVRAAERAAAPARVRPLPLMPGADDDDDDAEAGPAPEPEPAQAAQLTIVYGGRAVVLDGVPADRAAGLLRLAAAAAGAGAGAATERACVASAADLPVARKASLRRFMEKRKGRLAARAGPYGRPAAADLTLAL